MSTVVKQQQKQQLHASDAGNGQAINAPTMAMNTPSVTHSDESTIDSFELSIIEENLVSSTPKSFSPKPKLLRLVNEINNRPLGIELSQSLPIVSYIHPSSPLREILFVGDVILEFNGRKSTETNFHGLFASNKTNDVDKTRSILFLPGRKSPYNPESSDYIPDGVKWHGIVDGKALVVEETCATDDLTERSDSDERTTTHGQTDKREAELNSVCTVYLDEEANDESQESVHNRCNHVHQPTSPSLAQTLKEFVQEDKDVKDKIGLDTTTTTHSSSMDNSGRNEQLGSDNSSNHCNSIEKERNQPPAEIMPHVQSPNGSSNSINYPSSPLVLFDRPSPQSSVSFSGEFDNNSSMPSLPLSPISRQTDEKNQSHYDTEKNAEVLEVLKHTLLRNPSREFEDLCQSDLGKCDVGGSEVPYGDPSHNGENTNLFPAENDTTTGETNITKENGLPQSILKKNRKDRKKGKHKPRHRPPPTFDTIIIEQDWDEEDISTITGGRYNPNLHASNASVEDHIVDCIELGCDPNTLSQLTLSRIKEQNQSHNDNQALKVTLGKEDNQMKETQLKLLKRRHRMIEGIFAVFILVAIVVMIGVLVVILRAR